MATCRRVVFGAVLALAVAGPASASPLETCRRVIDRTGDWLVRSVNAIEAQCLARRTARLLSADTKCIGEGDHNDTISDATTQAAVDRTVERASDRIARQCSRDDLVFLPPQGLGFSASPGALDVIPSLIAAHLRASQTLMHARYPNETPVMTCVGPSLLVTLNDALGVGIAGVRLALSYPLGVSIPGTGSDANVYAHVQFLSANGLAAANDVDQAIGSPGILRLAAVTSGNLAGPFARVLFCLNNQEGTPPLDDFVCTVIDAATGDGDDPGATCELSLGAP